MKPGIDSMLNGPNDQRSLERGVEGFAEKRDEIRWMSDGMVEFAA
jgi:hypothetical protein